MYDSSDHDKEIWFSLQFISTITFAEVRHLFTDFKFAIRDIVTLKVRVFKARRQSTLKHFESMQ